MPAPEPNPQRGSIAEIMERNGVTRRSFLQWCAFISGVLALPAVPWAQQIASALSTKPRLPVIWLNAQDCNGNIEAFLRTNDPAPSSVLLDSIALNYSELVMAGSGTAAEKARRDTIAAGGHVLVVEGAIPTGAGGAYCMVGGRPISDHIKEAAKGALGVIAVGTCASWGGLPAAAGGVTGAVDLQTLLGTGTKVIRMPGCPVNGDNVVAAIVQQITTGAWPKVDSNGRPVFAYSDLIHVGCPRLAHFEAGRFVEAWGDKGHQNGWCLRHLGCRGPDSKVNCRTHRFNGATSYPIQAGATCLGCVRSDFWDVDGGFFVSRTTAH